MSSIESPSIFAPICAVETPIEQDAVASARREFKYVFEQADVCKIESILQVNCNRIAYNKAVSVVNSIYFDNDRLDDCAQSAAGAGERIKARLRWYDSEFPEGICFFEIKRRIHNAIKKDRTALNCSRPFSDLSYDQIHKGICEATTQESSVYLAERPQAVVLIQYKRQHFRPPGSLARITLDYDIEAYEQIGRNKPVRRFAAPLHDLVVLEAKAPSGAELDIRRALLPLRPSVGKCSKYFKSCQQLGLFAGSLSVFD